MKKAFITESYNDNNMNIYSIEHKKGNFNIPQSIKLPPDDIHNNIYKFILTDKYVEGINNITFHIKTPEIKGTGSMCYSENFMYKLIKNFKIYNNSTLIYQRNGFEFLSEFKKNDKYSTYYKLIGNNKGFLDFKTGKNDDDIIFKTKELSIPLITLFDQYLHTLLKIPSLSKLTIELELYNFLNVINYNMTFKNNLNKLINIDLEPRISMNLFNTRNELNYDRFIEHSEYREGGDDKEEYYTNNFTSITNIFWFVKSDLFINNRFISYPGYDLSEHGYINAFSNRLLEDLVIVSKDENFKKNKKFSEKCEFVKIDKLTNIYKFDKLNEVKINILNVPSDHEIYFHTNILTFNRRYKENTYNISKKYKYILGQYIANENRILLLDIKHELEIADVSIPVSKWDSNENTATGDLRSFESKTKDVIVNDLFIFGLDFLCKDKGYEYVTVRSGTSHDNIIDKSDTRQFNNHLIYKDGNYSLTELGKYLEPCFGFIKFNFNNINYIEPSRFKSDETNNLRSCTINVNWKKYNENNPKSLMTKKLVVGITHLKKLVYNIENNSLNISEYH